MGCKNWLQDRTVLFWVITLRLMVIPYRRFGTTYRSQSAVLIYFAAEVRNNVKSQFKIINRRIRIMLCWSVFVLQALRPVADLVQVVVVIIIIIIIIIIIYVMDLGHLLTRSGLTYREISSKVCHNSFCQVENCVSLPWVIYYEAFYLHVVSRSLFKGLP
jgi:hypothetical protein